MGRNPSVGCFRRDKIKNWPESFPRTTQKGYGNETTARLKVSGRTRTFRIVRSSDDPKRLRKEYQDKRPLVRGSPDATSLDHLNSKRRKLKGKNFKLVISFQ
jgi:hypothetical protein